MNERERAVHFYEMLTGVFNDQEAKITRYLCFGVLAAGLIFAGYSYFKTSVYSNVDRPLEDSDNFLEPRANTSMLQRVVELARAVDGIRQAGNTIASTMESLHNMPFNLNSEAQEDPIAALSTSGASTPENSTLGISPENPGTVASMLNVKMIMTDENGRKLAVADVGGEKALVLRRGDKLPDGSFVSSIRPDGITVIFNKQEHKYTVPEIPKYDKIK